MAMVLFLACTGTETKSVSEQFSISPTGLGEPVVDASGLDLGDMEKTAMILSGTLPIFHENPAWDTPWEVWGLTESNLVRDDGQCPTTEVLERGSLWRGGCRSTDGYEFEGEISDESWEEDGVDWHQLSGEMEVEGDIEDPLFEEMLIKGTVLQGKREDGLVHLDINLQVRLVGYWEDRAPADPRLGQWADWRVTGSFEDTEATSLFSVVTGIGEVGVQALGLDLVVDTGCPVELAGAVELTSGDQEAIASLGGVKSCDACAEISGMLACKP